MAGTGVDVTDIGLADSKADPRVQVADLLAGLGRVAAEDLSIGKSHPLLLSVKPMQSRFSIWPVHGHMYPQNARATVSQSHRLLDGDAQGSGLAAVSSRLDLIKKEPLPSELVVVVGRDGRRVRKHPIKLEDLDAAFSAEQADHHIAAIREAAPRFTEDRKARLAALRNPAVVVEWRERKVGPDQGKRQLLLQAGYFARSLDAYGREGEPCRRCSAVGLPGVIKREQFMNRSSYTCPICQPKPRNGSWQHGFAGLPGKSGHFRRRAVD